MGLEPSSFANFHVQIVSYLFLIEKASKKWPLPQLPYQSPTYPLSFSSHPAEITRYPEYFMGLTPYLRTILMTQMGGRMISIVWISGEEKFLVGFITSPGDQIEMIVHFVYVRMGVQNGVRLFYVHLLR